MELTPGTDMGQHVIALLTNMQATLANIEAVMTNMETVMINIEAILTRTTEGYGNEGEKTSIEPHTETED